MFELRLMCPEIRVEAMSEALEALDALSVSVEDAALGHVTGFGHEVRLVRTQEVILHPAEIAEVPGA